jgi:hypothetical protein
MQNPIKNYQPQKGFNFSPQKFSSQTIFVHLESRGNLTKMLFCPFVFKPLKDAYVVFALKGSFT